MTILKLVNQAALWMTAIPVILTIMSMLCVITLLIAAYLDLQVTDMLAKVFWFGMCVWISTSLLLFMLGD